MPTSVLPTRMTVGVHALTSGPEGHFSLDMARNAGLTSDDLARLIARGVIVRLARGVYARRDPSLAPPQRHRRTALAIASRTPQAVLSHHSALLAHGLPVFAADLSTVHLTHRTDRRDRRRRGFVIHRADHTTTGLPVGAGTVGVANAVVQVGLANPLATLVAADAALHLAMTTSAELKTVASTFSGRPGRASVTAMLRHTDARAQSPLESLTRHALTTLGHTVTPQVHVDTEGRGFDIDLVVDDIAVEVDGLSKYTAALDARDPVEIIRAEKAREAALVRAGYHVLRLTWGEVVAGDGTVRYDNVDRLITTMRTHRRVTGPATRAAPAVSIAATSGRPGWAVEATLG